MKVVSWFLLIIGIYIIYFNDEINGSQESQKIINKIKLIPPEDLNRIQVLFEHFFKFNEFGFTLFGDKPLSFCNSIYEPIFTSSKEDNLIWYCERILKTNKNYKSEWLTWEKYRHLFPINKFIFTYEDLGVVLVNRDELKKIISDNEAKFFKILGNDFNLNNFIRSIEDGKGLFHLLANNHELLGIVLGFGKQNSQLFQRREEILEVLEPHQIPKNLQIKIDPSPPYLNIEDELKDLWSKLAITNNYATFFPIVDQNRVIFVGNPSYLETQKLQIKYEIQGKKIKEILSKEDWLEQVLLRLTSS